MSFSLKNIFVLLWRGRCLLLPDHIKMLAVLQTLFMTWLLCMPVSPPDPVPAKALPLSLEEKALYKAIMSYRKQKGLPKIKISANLSKIAQMHADELLAKAPEEPCNMHSWTGKFGERACCYTDDHREAACMWNKPAEFSNYKATGFEIAAFDNSEEPDFLDGWKGSHGHNQVIINAGTWKKMEWKAVGVAIRKPYAVVWFGNEPDAETID